LALLILLSKIEEFIRSNRQRDDDQAIVIVDEGIAGHRKAIQLTPQTEIFRRGRIYFGKSSVVHPIQLADFAAFVANRSQLILGRKQFKFMDAALLKTFSRIVENYQGWFKIDLHAELAEDGFFKILEMKERDHALL